MYIHSALAANKDTTRAPDTADAIRRYHNPAADQEIGWFEKMPIELGIGELSFG